MVACVAMGKDISVEAKRAAGRNASLVERGVQFKWPGPNILCAGTVNDTFIVEVSKEPNDGN